MGRKYKKDLHRGSNTGSTGATKHAKECGTENKASKKMVPNVECGLIKLDLKEGSSADWNLFRE